jgi:hypothetical protein
VTEALVAENKVENVRYRCAVAKTVDRRREQKVNLRSRYSEPIPLHTCLQALRDACIWREQDEDQDQRNADTNAVQKRTPIMNSGFSG